MSNDYIRFQQINQTKNVNLNLAATDAGLSDVITPRTSGHQIWIQKILYSPTTVAAQTVTFRDDAGTPVPIGQVPASQATPLLFDFGPTGVPLTVGTNLDIVNVAGPAAKIHIEAYQRLLTPAAAGSTNV